MYRLIFLNGKFKGRRLAVHQGAILLGRDPECHIHLADDDEVSRKHATIEERENGVFIRDAGSLNKFMVNDQELSEAQLKHNDLIVVGKTRIQFQQVQTGADPHARRGGGIQRLTIAAVALVVLMELGFLAALLFWRQEDAGPLPPAGALEEERQALVIQEGEGGATGEDQKLMAEARARLIQLEQEQAHSLDFTSRVPERAVDLAEELRQLRADVDNIREKVADIVPTSPPAAVAESAPTPTAAVAAVTSSATTLTTIAAAASPTTAAAAATTPPATTQQWMEMSAVLAAQAAPAATGESPAMVAAFATTGLPVTAITTSAPPAAIPAGDPVLAKAKELLRQALEEEQRMNLLEADAQLERIQILAPDFLPAYLERARLLENRGQLQKAGEQWAEVLKRSLGTPRYMQAAAQRLRIARAEMAQSLRQAPAAPEEKTAGGLPRRIRIENVEHQKFPANEQFDEMRLLRITLKPAATEKRLDSDEVRAAVFFFDQDADGGVHVTGAVAPRERLRLEAPFVGNRPQVVTAAYIVPKDFRAKEAAQTGKKRKYLGYVVRLYYKDALQDEEGKPALLLKEKTTPPMLGKP